MLKQDSYAEIAELCQNWFREWCVREFGRDDVECACWFDYFQEGFHYSLRLPGQLEPVIEKVRVGEPTEMKGKFSPRVIPTRVVGHVDNLMKEEVKAVIAKVLAEYGDCSASVRMLGIDKALREFYLQRVHKVGREVKAFLGTSEDF